MTHHPIDRRRSVRPPVALALAFIALALAVAKPGAQQAPPGAPRPSEVALQHGRPFRGDVRGLPNGLPAQRETRPRPEREEPSIPTTGGREDRAAQTIAPSLPAPSPGTGGGVGSTGGLDFANWGDGWPPDTN